MSRWETAGVGATNSGYAVPKVTQQSTSVAGSSTYILSISLNNAAENIYSLYGDTRHPMIVPASYQVSSPFGVNFGGVPTEFYQFSPNSEFDSWLTIGPTNGTWTRGPGTNGLLSAIGIDWDGGAAAADEWLRVDDGALFWMDPDQGPGGSSPGRVCHYVPILV
jgi:hypothetical protein